MGFGNTGDGKMKAMMFMMSDSKRSDVKKKNYKSADELKKTKDGHMIYSAMGPLPPLPHCARTAHAAPHRTEPRVLRCAPSPPTHADSPSERPTAPRPRGLVPSRL